VILRRQSQDPQPILPTLYSARLFLPYRKLIDDRAATVLLFRELDGGKFLADAGLRMNRKEKTWVVSEVERFVRELVSAEISGVNFADKVIIDKKGGLSIHHDCLWEIGKHGGSWPSIALETECGKVLRNMDSLHRRTSVHTVSGNTRQCISDPMFSDPGLV
jgi:hypothetical protein